MKPETLLLAVLAKRVAAISSMRGPKGDVGDRGEKGDRGEQGPQGIQGPVGARGAAGPRGDRGSEGPPGRDGREGAAGKDGRDGIDAVFNEDELTERVHGRLLERIRFYGSGTGRPGVGVPPGGTANQALVKASGDDYDTKWVTGGAGGATWGAIGGTLSDQTDLQSALNAKASTSHAGTHSVAGSDPLNVTTLAGYTGDTSKFLRADGTFAAVPDTDPTLGETEVDFGTKPVYESSFTLVNAAITTSSKITMVESGNIATNRVAAGDALFDSVVFAALPAAGSATIYARAVPGPVVGARKLFYQIGA